MPQGPTCRHRNANQHVFVATHSRTVFSSRGGRGRAPGQGLRQTVGDRIALPIIDGLFTLAFGSGTGTMRNYLPEYVLKAPAIR